MSEWGVWGSSSRREQIGRSGVESVQLLQSIGIGTSVAVVPLWSWHCYLMGSAQTTIEYFGNGEAPARSHRQRAAPGANPHARCDLRSEQ